MLKFLKEELVILCVCKKGSSMIYIIVLLGVVSVLGALSFKLSEITRLYSTQYVDYTDLYNLLLKDDYITYINEELNKKENYDKLFNDKSIEINDKCINLSLDEANNIIICKYGNSKINLKYINDNNRFIVYPLKKIYME